MKPLVNWGNGKIGTLLTQNCTSRESITQDVKTVVALVRFNFVQVCPKCSGGTVCGVTYQVFHPFQEIPEQQLHAILADLAPTSNADEIII